ncbi:ABC transporter ATP-binding protein [Oenococcus sicerae]|uniref:ABC transporter ATP-binding protein n=1 Tax=Oenococcus sicerae TaxID=2203724 RepID=UPI0010BB45B1|nr:putative ABC transporter ATP-binding protein NosF {ECO:0000305} [Oenococcus sicerae]
MAVIDMQHLTMNFGSKKILKDLSTQIQTGEIVGLIGLNGAGKSTLINLMLGLLTPSKGQLTIFGEKANETKHLDRIGVMFQNATAVDHVTVSEQLDWLRSFYENPAPLSTLLAAAGLSDMAKEKASSLSGGQLRRLCFAQALSGQADLLFLDEPTAGMDIISRKKFWLQIAQLKQAGKTIILTSHYLDEIEQVATRLLILKDGHFIHDGSLSQLRNHFDQKVVSFDSDLPIKLFTRLTGVVSVTKKNQSVRLITQNSDLLLRQLLKLDQDSVKNIYVEKNSLNDLFSELVEEKSVELPA